MLALLRELIPGAQAWPRFLRNRSEQFEARLGLVEILESPSVLFAGMQGSVLPIAVSHGEGPRRVHERRRSAGLQPASSCWPCGTATLAAMPRVSIRPNPNGSPAGIAALTTPDGRVTVMMPHPERVFRSVQNSWAPADAGEDSGWMRMFRNARSGSAERRAAARRSGWQRA